MTGSVENFPTAAELRADGMGVHETPDTMPGDVARWLYNSREECLAAIRMLNWVCANSDVLIGYCTLPSRRDNMWEIYTSVAAANPSAQDAAGEDEAHAFDALEHLVGAFADGYTSEDIDAILGILSDETGLELVATWDYVDFCTGGNSDIHCLSQGRLFEVPDQIHNLLFARDPEEVVLDLRIGIQLGLEPGADVGPCPPHLVGERNYCYERR